MTTAKRYPTALTIAGSDSGGCAGIQADIKTFSSLGVFGASVVTALTAQNTVEIRAVEVLSPETVRLQLETVLDDMKVDSLKTGMLPSVGIIEVVAGAIDRYSLSRVVADPVMVATSGARLVCAATLDAVRSLLYPRISLLTPNIPEAEALSGISIRSEADMHSAARVILDHGCPAVLIKGGHSGQAISDGDGENHRTQTATDILFRRDMNPVVFSSPRSDSRNLHGTGCTLSSAIAARMALGDGLDEAVGAAKRYIHLAIEGGRDAVTGRGGGPVNHFFSPKPLKAK